MHGKPWSAEHHQHPIRHLERPTASPEISTSSDNDVPTGKSDSNDSTAESEWLAMKTVKKLLAAPAGVLDEPAHALVIR